MRCPVRSNGKRPANLANLVPDQEEQVFLEIVEKGVDPGKRKLQSVCDVFSTQGLSLVARQLAYYEVPDKMVVAYHEAEPCRWLVLRLSEVLPPVLSRHFEYLLAPSDQDNIFHPNQILTSCVNNGKRNSLSILFNERCTLSRTPA